MRFKVAELYARGELFLEEDIDYSNIDFSKDTDIKGIKSCHVVAHVQDQEDLIRVDFKINAITTLLCSYSLELFDYKLKCSEYIELSDDEKYDNGDIFIDKRNVITLDEYILPIIKCYVPMVPIKPGAKLPDKMSY